MSREPRKPTGFTGPFEVTVEEGSAHVAWHCVDFPPKKEDVEALIVRGFLTGARKLGIIPVGTEACRRNEQDDLDFTLQMPGGTKYLELMEIAPLADAKSYLAADGAVKPYEIGRFAFEKVMKKSVRYAAVARDRGIGLLLYVTHWAFTLEHAGLEFLQYWTAMTEHSFEVIYYYRPHSRDIGTIWPVFPTPREHWVGFDPELHRNAVVYHLLPAGTLPMDGGAAVAMAPRMPGVRKADGE